MITIVSGLPRSGTSMMMQMLAAGGMPILGDTERRDESNPRGYYEWSDITLFPLYPKIIAQAEGKAVKLTSNFLCFLPTEFEYKIILMERPLAEVLASMQKMQQIQHPEDKAAEKAIAAPEFGEALASLRREAFYWLSSGRRRNRICAPHFWLRVFYHDVLRKPEYIAEWISGALLPGELPRGFDVPAAARAVDLTLYRTRAPEQVTKVIQK